MPQSLAAIDFVLEEANRQFALTMRGTSFLRYDNKSATNRLLKFVSDEGMRHLSAASFWQADGTFRECPSMFYQLYLIHGVVDAAIFPCVYAALANKQTDTYKEMFEALRRLGLDTGLHLEPKQAMIDFELAARAGLRYTFPSVDLRSS